MKRLSLPYFILRSGAKFEPIESFLKETIEVDTDEKSLVSCGIPISQIDANTYATTKDELHCFVIGETGCGKTRRVILPSIQLMAKTGQSLVVSDPKGELYRKTADNLKKHGYDVKVLNFRKPRCGNRWNPLSEVERLYREGGLENIDKALMMMDDMVSILSSNIEDSEDPYWSISAASVFRGIALIILEYGEVGTLTFENVATTARDIVNALNHSQNPKFAEINRFLKEKLPENSPIRQNLDAIIINAESTRKSIMSVFNGMVSMYCNQELLLDLFSKSEIDIASLGKKPTALFFILPDDSDALYPIATYFVKQVYSALISLADEQPDGKLPNRVTFLLDEFANFAKLPTMHAMLTAARSRLIRFVLVCQSMDQLGEKYGERGMEILLSNCRVWLYMKCRNLPFLEHLQKTMGDYTSPYTGETCPLIDVGALQHFKIGQVLVLNDSCRPMIGYLEDYDKYLFGEGGHGVDSPLPEPNPVVKRKLFDFASACQKLNNGEDPKKSEKIVNRSAERAPEMHPTASENDDLVGDDSDADLQELLAKVDAKIAELEKMAKAQEKALVEARRYEDMISTGFDSVGTKNNLAYLIRHYELDLELFESKIPNISIESLLKQGVSESHSFSLMNMALYLIEKKRIVEALQLMQRIAKSDFVSLKDFWYETLWKSDHESEGALVSYICYLNKAFTEEVGGIVLEWFKEIRKNKAFDSFMKHPDVMEWIKKLQTEQNS